MCWKDYAPEACQLLEEAFEKRQRSCIVVTPNGRYDINFATSRTPPPMLLLSSGLMGGKGTWNHSGRSLPYWHGILCILRQSCTAPRVAIFQ